MKFSDTEYFMWEDTGKDLIYELVNFKATVHNLMPEEIRNKVFAELDKAINIALTRALNFELIEDFKKTNAIYLNCKDLIDD